jgi:hypothetical protein
MLVPLAGGGQESLLSEVGFVLLPLFTTRDACALRLVCREFLAAVSEHPWEDGQTAIKGSIAAWRACFPHARCANIAHHSFTGGEVRIAPVEDADFVHFEGLRELNMLGSEDVTDAAFVHLRDIHSLEMSFCFGLTDAALPHLVGIQRLGVAGCDITDAAFAHLRGIAFVHLRGIRTLAMDQCTQATITGATFSSLAGIGFLGIDGCSGVVAAAAHALELPVTLEEPLGFGGAFYPWEQSADPS